MVMNECSACPRCGGRLKYYDSVPRLVRTKGRQTSRVPMRRLRCSGCGAIHRELGGLFFPYKQYEAEVIFRVLEGLITARHWVRGLPLRDDHAPVAFAESTAPIMEKSISERSK